MATPSVRLLSGYDMPLVGLGTWQSQGEEIEKALLAALEIGYRHIDTSFYYLNEEAIGNSLKKWFENGGKREELFVTTKLPTFANRANDVELAIKLSLKKLQLDYLDMYLIHMPYGFLRDPNAYNALQEPDGSDKVDYETDHVAMWKAMEDQVKNGNTRSIGLSNFNERQITKIWNSAEIKPSNLQIELHACNQQKALRELCKKYNIAVTGFSSLGSPGAKAVFKKVYNHDINVPDLLGDPVVKKIAVSHHKTPAQVLLHHLVKHRIIVIPQSTDPVLLKENFELFDFELTKEETNLLDALDQGRKGRIFDFTFFKGIKDHPEYPFKDEVDQ